MQLKKEKGSEDFEHFTADEGKETEVFDDEGDSIAQRIINATTPMHDDPSTLAFTPRAIFLGVVWAVFLSCANTLFSFRTNWFV
jgi:hypothetical protein